LSALSQTWSVSELESELGASSIIILYLSGSIPPLIVLIGLWRLRQLFTSYSEGEIYTEKNARHLFVFAAVLLASELMKPVLVVIASSVVSLLENWLEISVVLNLNLQINVIFIAGIFMTVSWIMYDASRLADENARMV
jgi:hypothetical protein